MDTIARLTIDIYSKMFKAASAVATDHKFPPISDPGGPILDVVPMDVCLTCGVTGRSADLWRALLEDDLDPISAVIRSPGSGGYRGVLSQFVPSVRSFMKCYPDSQRRNVAVSRLAQAIPREHSTKCL
jgi:hypothetical protein